MTCGSAPWCWHPSGPTPTYQSNFSSSLPAPVGSHCSFQIEYQALPLRMSSGGQSSESRLHEAHPKVPKYKIILYFFPCRWHLIFTLLLTSQHVLARLPIRGPSPLCPALSGDALGQAHVFTRNVPQSGSVDNGQVPRPVVSSKLAS